MWQFKQLQPRSRVDVEEEEEEAGDEEGSGNNSSTIPFPERQPFIMGLFLHFFCVCVGES